jgi:hypothetical protein
MFIKHEFEESALTPELGGKFSNMRLKVKANLEKAQRIYRSNYMETGFNKNHQKEVFFNKIRFMADYNQSVLNLVVGWENVIDDDKQPVPFTKENVDFLENYFDSKTGFEETFDIFDTQSMQPTGEKETRIAKLGEYISIFASKVENFEKNL